MTRVIRLDYKIVHSNRKTLAIQITRDGEVIVRSPMRCPKKTVSDFVDAHEEWISSKLLLMEERRAEHPEPSYEEERTLRRRAADILPEKVRRYAEIMGVAPAGITVTGARTRFGSCSGKNRLSFSFRLMTYPDEAIDYVVVHELAHIVHKNHGSEFYDLIGSVLPDYRERIKLLR